MKRLLTGGMVAAAALLLAGCSPFAGSGSDAGGSVPPDTGVVKPDPGIGELQPEPGDGTSVESEADDRSIITSGQVSLSVDDPIPSADRAASIVTGAGGRVDSRSEHPETDTQPPSAFLVLRIPSERLDAVIDDLRTLGEVNSVSINLTDVTMQTEDLDARITALQASVDRLLDLLADATTITDLVAIESELTTRQADLDSLTAQRESLDDQVDYSTISLELLATGVVEPAGPDDFWGGVVAGWNALVGFGSGLVIALGVMLPWLGLLAVLALIVLLIAWAAHRASRRPTDASAVGSRTGQADGGDVVVSPEATAGDDRPARRPEA
jgi:hypothetical protein